MKEDYFEDFKWVLPKSFADALSKCLFEIGDVLYDNLKAYTSDWGEAKKILKHSIQVKSISSSSTKTDETNNESVFSDNWDSEITFDYFSYPSMQKVNISTTQGALYSFLWTGKEDLILSSKQKIRKPLLQKYITKNISKYVSDIKKTIDNDYDYLFIFPVNIANQFHNEKSQKIISSFNNNSEQITYKYNSYSSKDLGIESLNICPTIKFIVFEIKGSIDVINESLKNALYIPSKNKKSEKEYFRLKSHGILINK